VIVSDVSQGESSGAGVTIECVIRSRWLRDRFSPENRQTMIDPYRSGTPAMQSLRSSVSACAASHGCSTSTTYTDDLVVWREGLRRGKGRHGPGLDLLAGEGPGPWRCLPVCRRRVVVGCWCGLGR
jgi:transposase-like protein